MKERAGREIKPLHVAAICKEIEHNWKAGKGLPRKKDLTREDIDAMIAAERKALREKRSA